MKRKILLGLTGSVATVLYEKLIKELSVLGEVSVILTEKASHFLDRSKLHAALGYRPNCIVDDYSEWNWSHNGLVENKWMKNDTVLHINLRDKASALVIAPCSANTLAKVSYGLCDNLLTTVARAWDLNRPFVIAPAMNTYMMQHPTTGEHLLRFIKFSKNCHNVPMESKMLACGTYGAGAMGEISEIVKTTKEALQWKFPLKTCNGIPDKGHPGSFACQRKHEKHTGVDLYCKDKELVHAVEDGTVVGKEGFTGPQVESPWWNDTDCLLVEGATGVVVYGEISVPYHINVGCKVMKGQYIGNVKRVLTEGKERNDIMGHSTSMLHMELYPHGFYKASKGFDEFLDDVTPYLLESEGCPTKKLTV